MCKIVLGEDSYGLVNVYSPTEGDDPKFFKNIENQMRLLECDFWICGGDFNVTMDPILGQLNKREYKPQTRNQLYSLCNNFDLCDVWREFNGVDKKFTWFRRKPKPSASRIDYFLILNCLKNKSKTCNIYQCTLTDHSSVKLVLETNVIRRGPGMWRFNNLILKDQRFVKHIKQFITGLKRVYEYMDPVELWEMLKSEVIKECKKYSQHRARNNKLYKCNLYKTMEILQEEIISNCNTCTQLENSLRNTQAALDSIQEAEAKKAAFINKCRFVKDREKIDIFLV